MAQIDGGEEKRWRLKAFISVVFKKTPFKPHSDFHRLTTSVAIIGSSTNVLLFLRSYTWYLKKKVKLPAKVRGMHNGDAYPVILCVPRVK